MLIATCRDDLVALWVEGKGTDLIIVTLEDRGTGSCIDVINPSHTIGTGSGKFGTSLIEAGVEHLICVTSELLDALSRTNIPKARRTIDTSGQDIVTSEIELATR